MREATSTNDVALRAAETGDSGALWVVADQQTQGRGRHGRSWHSPEGNLFASLLLINPCDPILAAQLGFVAGLALHEALSGVSKNLAMRLTLKWPNDVLLDGAKCAGILLEGHRLPNQNAFAVIIGIGVNIAHAPADMPYPATALHRLDTRVNRVSLFEVLSDAFSRRFLEWHNPRQGFVTIREDWLVHAAGLGGAITLRLPHQTKTGIFAGLDAFGRLELHHPSTKAIEYLDAGDLFFVQE